MQPRSERPAGRTQSPEHGSPGPAPEAPPPPPPPQPPAPEAERARPRQARPTAPMEGTMQLLSREGHAVSHNSKRHYHDAFVAMSRMRQRGLLCDIVLHVAAKEIRAHKVVLASCSPYFHAMFTNEMSESRQTHVTLHDIDPQALDQLVQFAYTAEIVVGEGNVQTLLPAASLLQLNGVRDACCKFLLSQLDPSNCLGIRGFADTHSCGDLLKAAHRYVLQHFVDVAKTEEFMLLPLKQVLELVSSDSLNVPSEEDVYRAVLSWVKHDVDARRQHVPRLMKCVRLPLLSRDFLLGHVDAESLVRHHPDCKDLLIEALKFHLLPEQRGVLGTSRTRPRRCEGAGPVLFAVGGGSLFAIHGDCEAYDTRTDRWHVVASMSTRRARVGVAAVGNRLYAVGGYDGTSDLATVESYDPVTNTWQPEVSMGTRRSCLGVAALHGLLYAAGGYDGASCLNSAERYDPLTGTWTSIAAMSTRRRYVRVAMLGGRLHCVAPSPRGSHTQRGRHECVHSLQMETCMPWVAMTAHHTWPPWRSMSPRCEIPQSHIPVPQRCLRSTLWPPLSPRGSSLYVHVVSQTPHPGVEVCTCREGGWWWVGPQPIPPPQVNSWTPVASMLSRRSSAGVAVLEGALYVAGGNDGTSCLNSVERYSPKAGAWESVAPMNIRRSTHDLVAMDGWLYAVGGNDGSSSLNSIEKYNPRTNKWVAASCMFTRRSSVGVAVLELLNFPPPSSPTLSVSSTSL
ncbi:kelch-like protein 17 isoform X1 [Bos mutus]|uniref:kelch-like protein 17 isoform X1 n=1 Tax=Bos mutus TaxID=72004 RepID=UPI0038B5D7B3